MFIKNEHNKLTVKKAKQFHYSKNWISNDQINQNLPKSFYKALQITQKLKFI